jgi:hypothetical protein
LPEEGVLGGLLADRRAAADAMTAASIASVSKPPWVQNLPSSAATTARIMLRSIRSIGTQVRAAPLERPTW